MMKITQGLEYQNISSPCSVDVCPAALFWHARGFALLAGNNMSDENVSTLASSTLRHLSHLVSLKLDDNSLGPGGARMLFTCSWTQLECLSLKWNYIGSQGVQSLASAGGHHWPHLQVS
jgi:hypothetical protein